MAFWVEFLEQHAEAFNSIDILDDVAIALKLMPDDDDDGWTVVAALSQLDVRVHQLLSPIISENKIMPWVATENRLAIRLLVDAAFDLKDSKKGDCFAPMRILLRLNPNDNHDLRDVVVSELLARNNNDEALAIAQQYPDDSAPR